MGAETWTAVDEYFIARLGLSDAVLDAVQAEAQKAGLPAISVSAAQGRLLHLLVLLSGARSILEIGTLAGYSAIWMARSLPPGGRLITLEYEPKHAEVARANIARAGLADKVEIRVGAALDTLPKIAAAREGPFDLVFIDADKPSSPEYVEWAIELSRRGAVIVLDNVVRSGKVILADGDDAVQGVRRAIDIFGSDPRVSATAIQTVGTKGYDGFAMALVVGEP